MFCSKCGNQVSDHMKFCNNCGAIIEVYNNVEHIIPAPNEIVATKKSPVKKIVLLIAIAAVVIAGLVITNYIINPPISGPEVLYDLEWGMTYDEVKEVDNRILPQGFDRMYDENYREEKYGALSTIGYDHMHISAKYSGAVITYYFGLSDSLERIEVQYMADESSKAINCDVMIKKLEKYYNAVCDVSPTKDTSEDGDNEMLIWNTGNNQISVGESYGYVIVDITPAK